MFAIALTEENLPKILEEVALDEGELNCLATYIRLKWPHYFVRGYVFRTTGEVLRWTIIPTWVFSRGYEFDIVKAQTDWDQIVRKESK